MSTLVVENLQGPSTGTNANTITIPSGHTLDASGGLFTPSAGQIVQQIETFGNSNFSTSSTTLVATGTSLSITPKFSNSKINIFIFATAYAAAAGGAMGGIYKDGSAISGYANEDLLAYTTNTQNMSDMTCVVYTDQNVGTTSSVTYTYYIKSGSGNTVYFYRNSGVILQEIKQ